MNLGAALAGGGGARRAEDFYPTPVEATLALLDAAGRYIGPKVHEPACGDGAMSVVLRAHGYEVIATDLVDRDYGQGGVDFLKSPILAPSVITNPPFNAAPAFITHVAPQRPAFFALLLKSTFWNAAKRISLFEAYQPKLILPLSWRLDFTGGGAPTMDCTWFCWGTNLPDAQVFRPLPKPTGQWGIFA